MKMKHGTKQRQKQNNCLKIEELKRIEDNIQIERAHRSFSKYDSTRPRQIILKLLNFEDKGLILRKANLLKGKNIFINEDYSETTMLLRKKLFAEVKEHRKNGFFARMVHKKIVFDESKNGFVAKD